MAIMAFAKTGQRGNPDVLSDSEISDILSKASDSTKIAINAKNPKRTGSSAAARYSKYSAAKTIAQYAEAGGTMSDLKYDLRKGFVTIVG